MTHPSPKRNMVPKAVLMRSGLVSLTTARPVNTAQPKTTVNSTRPMINVFNKAHSTVRRPINNKTTTKNSNFNKRVNTVSGKNVNTARPKAVVNTARPKAVLNACINHSEKGNPQMDLQDQGVIDSGCSRHMTGNMSYLTDFEEIDGGYVAFGGNPKGGKITGRGTIKTGNLDFENVYFVRELQFNLFSVSQMCDKKNSVLFNDTECIVLSPNFKLTDESHVLLKVPRKNNMYSVDLKNIVPKGGLTCLFAKATSDESKLWHRRLGHINFKTMNKLVKGNLVQKHVMMQVKLEWRQYLAKITFCYHCGLLIYHFLKIQRVLMLLDSNLQEILKKIRYDNPGNNKVVILNTSNKKNGQEIWEETWFVEVLFSKESNHIKDFQQLLVCLLFITRRNKKIDVKVLVLYGKIEEKVYVCQPLGKIDKTLFIRRDKGDILLVQVYVDDIIFGSIKKSLCTEFKKMMHRKFQMSSIGELTFFLRLQVKQKEDGIFISQDKYVTEILKKFGFFDVKTASTPMETQKPLLKDEDGEEVDVHLYRSMIDSLNGILNCFKTSMLFCCSVCTCTRYKVNPKMSHLHAVKRIFRYLKGQPKLGLWYLKDSPFDLVAYTDSDYVGASLDRKSTTGGLGDQEDASKQGRKIADIDADAEVTLVDDTTETQVRFNDDLMFDTSVLDEQEVETLIEIKAAKPKVRGVMIQEPSELTTTTTTTTPAASKPSQDKGKAKMTKPEKPLKKKDQIMYDQEVALNLQAQLQAELDEEERHARQKEEEVNIALIESWDNTQATMDADYQMAQQLQVGV
ncbi:ribonuclease H-like domain-containing protein [Tanacetum coccineum]|uniref:Ribonuclease H-like domain-containing protein n=1 Tax=Tanacetum coccineum TaxID=301880 RepID=A0ABQ5G0D4_9ASTR